MNTPDLRTVVNGSNISNIFIHANEDIRIRYGISLNDHRYDNAFLFCVVYESKLLALHTIPVVCNNISH